ncbi:MAG: hypothetical protein Q7I89_01185 [Syntrophales bacterium]|nr:hypothetical protein [Syntrophales bacterium]
MQGFPQGRFFLCPHQNDRIHSLIDGVDDPFDSGCVKALRTFHDAFAYKESDIIGMVYGSAMDAGEIRANQKVMQAAIEPGKKLASE